MYQVKPLTKDNAEIFAEYLGELDFSHAPHWGTCFCRFYYTNCPGEEWKARSGEHNKQEALEDINQENMKGLLAFDGDKCIGWCSANDVSRFPRIYADVKEILGDKKTGCVICYVIHPEYRRQGVARLLLKTAIESFREDGFDAVLALPVDMKSPQETHYRGTINMYLENGFKEIKREEELRIMLLDL